MGNVAVVLADFVADYLMYFDYHYDALLIDVVVLIALLLVPCVVVRPCGPRDMRSSVRRSFYPY